MTEEYQIRQATFKDAPELARLRWEFSEGEAAGTTFDEFRDGFTRFLNEAFCRNNWNVWVAEQNNRLIANVFVHQVLRVPRPGQTQDRWGYVTNVFVAPEFRSQGLGSELFQTIIGWAREQGLELLLVWPSDESVPFYERLGFVRAAEVLELAL